MPKGNSVDKAELLVFNEFLSETKTAMFTECEERWYEEECNYNNWKAIGNF